jgi:O-antigen ligase
MAVAAAGAIVLSGVLLLFPDVAFLATCFVIPIERLGRLTPDTALYTISLMRIVGMIALLSFLMRAFLRGIPLRLGPALVLYAAYVGIAFLGVTHSSDQATTTRVVGAMLGNLMFFFLVINLVRDWETARRAAMMWLASTVLVALFTMYNWHLGGTMTEHTIGEQDTRFSVVLEDNSEYETLDIVARATGPTSHSAVYGINLIMTVPFFFYFLRRARNLKWKALILGALVIVLYNILLTNTRAILILAVLVLLLCAALRLYRVTAGGLIAALLVGCAMLPLIPESVYERVLDPSNYTASRSGTLRSRLDFWQAGLQIAQKEWLTGIGVGNQLEVPKHMRGVAPDATTVHNIYLMTFMETGLFGWLLFYAFVALVTWSAFRVAKLLRSHAQAQDQYWFFIAAQITMLAVLIDGLQVDVFLFPLKGWWLVAGMSWAMHTMLKTQPVVPDANAA